MALLSILDRDRTIARPGYSRWLIPPAALCVHLCIGQAYAFSVFNLPMTKLIGITKPAQGDWELTDLGWIFMPSNCGRRAWSQSRCAFCTPMLTPTTSAGWARSCARSCRRSSFPYRRR